MSQPSRPRANGPEQRRSKKIRLDAITPLEERQLLAPFVSVGFTTSVFLPPGTAIPGRNIGGQTLTSGAGTALPSQTGASVALTTFPEAAAITSVSQFTPNTSFGGDIVRIRTGPGGDFGNALYAVSRGAGDNLGLAVNRPGVIYRVDTATGKSSVFFDLNTVIPQLDPTQTSAANNAGDQTGLVNWYDMTFDREGIFDGKPSMFVSSVDSSNPTKNAIYRIAPDGTFLGAFTTFSDNSLNSARLTFNPSAILVPPVEQQTFLRGLLTGTGNGSFTGLGALAGATGNGGFGTATGSTFAALFFDATTFRPGTPLNSLTLKNGVRQTGDGFNRLSGLALGPQTGLTAANSTYGSLIYSSFADFGTPAVTNGNDTLFPAQPGLSGVQGLNGEVLINQGFDPNALGNTVNNPTSNIDLYPVASTNFRRFQDIAFDQYGYFSQGLPLTTTAGTGTGGTTGGTTGTGTSVLGTVGAPVYAGSLFVSDLSNGLAVSVTVPAPAPPITLPTGTPTPNPIILPVQGPGPVGIIDVSPITGQPTTVTFPGSPSSPLPVVSGSPYTGGRIVRIDQFGRVTNFAQGFATNNSVDSSSFNNSSLSITFSSDGTTLYASDDQGVWQFKTTASLAGSSSGSLVGLNDLRTLGVPYDGSNSAVAVVDTGVDAQNPAFRGRVAPGTSTTIPGGLGNDDFAAGLSGIGTTGGTGGTANTGGGTNTSTLGVTQNGHGTPVAGIIAQFVPQATLNPINVFQPFVVSQTTGGGVTFATNQATTTDAVFSGLQYVANNPYVADPVRPGSTDRTITASLAFGTSQTFETEQTAYKQYPQVVISFKNQLDKLLKVGIAPIAAAGQFGAPVGATSGLQNPAVGATNNAENTSVGDLNGMSLPAILNEVISVTGTYPFIYQTSNSSPPTDPAQTILGRTIGPVLVFGNTVNSPGALGDSTTGGTTVNAGTTANTTGNSLGQLTAADGFGVGNAGGGGGTGGTTATGSLITFSDRLLGSANRNNTTDFAAPALDAPTFRRFFGTNTNPNTFIEGGTSVSSAIVTGSYALVSSALDYWNQVRKLGTTASAYLNTPVGSHTLNYGLNKLYNLSTYNTPNGINSILAYTAVPAADLNDNLTLAGPPKLLGSTLPRSYARVDIGNAIAAIEGKVALDYLIKHKTFNIIDTNKNGLITAQEIQNFVDTANARGLAEAGAMARLLGGTARSAMTNSFTDVGEQPDQPDVLQRRFNFFDYAAHGKLQGSISISQLKLLSRYILPTPDAYTITDRQRASVNGFLIAPQAQRNFKNLQHLQRGYLFVPKGAYKRYNGVSPAQFGVNSNIKGDGAYGPVYTLFTGKAGTSASSTTSASTSTNGSTTANLPNIPLTATTTLGSVGGSAADSTSYDPATAATTTTTTTAASSTSATATSATSTATVVANATNSTATAPVAGTTTTDDTVKIAQQIAALVAPEAAAQAMGTTPAVTTGQATPKAATTVKS